jgi:hypothetical protein
VASNNNQGRFDGHIAHAFTWPLKVFFGGLAIYIGIGLLGIMMALCWSHFVWQNPVEASDALLKAETSRSYSYTLGGISTMAEFTMRWTYWLFFQFTTIHDATYAYLNGYEVNQLDRIFFKVFIQHNVHEIFVAMNMNRVYGLRITYFLTSLPLFVIAQVVAHVDGLTERYIRRACAGRESTDMNRLGKTSKLMFFATGITVYLCLPIPLDPFWLIGPLLVVYVLGTRIQWQFYKKYL